MADASTEEHRGFRHGALFYADDDEFLAGTVPLVREALAAEHRVLAAVREPNAQLLRAGLGADAGRIRFLAMESVGRNPARIIPVWRDFVDAYAAEGRGGLGIGEPAWPGRTSAELIECQHHEALLNAAFETGPSWRLVCPYDASALPDEVLVAAARTHPLISSAVGSEPSASYVAERDGRPFTGPLGHPPDDAERVEFGAYGIAGLRHRVVRRAGEAGLGAERAADLGLAATELISNSVRHGGGSGVLWLWREGDSLVCEVGDAGSFGDPLVGRLPPSRNRAGGRGLWLTNQLCDLVQIRNAPEGARVRLRMRIEAAAPLS